MMVLDKRRLTFCSFATFATVYFLEMVPSNCSSWGVQFLFVSPKLFVVGSPTVLLDSLCSCRVFAYTYIIIYTFVCVRVCVCVHIFLVVALLRWACKFMLARSLANILMFCKPCHLRATSCRMRKSLKRWKKSKFQAALSVARTRLGTVVCVLLDV